MHEASLHVGGAKGAQGGAPVDAGKPGRQSAKRCASARHAALRIGHCRQHLAAFKCPKTVDVIPAMPRNASGKLLKRDLRAPYWAGRARQVN